MKKCENCENEHNGSYGSGRFCSSKCARGFSTKANRNEISEKVSKKLIGRHVKRNISKERWEEINNKRNKFWKNKLMNCDFNSLGVDTKRKRIILEQENKCDRCKLSEWLGEEITLELEHIDGNHHNNERNNLKALCPNCHSLTPTWRGRNKKNNINRGRVEDKELFNSLLKNNFNMRQSLLQVGLAAKGGNYGRCHKLKREYEKLYL